MFTPLSSTGRRSPSLLKRSAPHALSRSGPTEVAGPQFADGGTTTLGGRANESSPLWQKSHARHLHQSQWCVSLGLHHDAHDAKLMSPRSADAHAMRAFPSALLAAGRIIAQTIYRLYLIIIVADQHAQRLIGAQPHVVRVWHPLCGFADAREERSRSSVASGSPMSPLPGELNEHKLRAARMAETMQGQRARLKSLKFAFAFDPDHPIPRVGWAGHHLHELEKYLDHHEAAVRQRALQLVEVTVC